MATYVEGVAAAAGATPRLVVADMRFSEGRDFAAGAAALGKEVVTLSGDVTQLWYRLCRPGDGNTRCDLVAGLTAYDLFFCIEQLARDAGLVVRSRIDHVVGSDGTVEQVRIGSTASSRVPIGVVAVQAAQAKETLVSWVLARAG